MAGALVAVTAPRGLGGLGAVGAVGGQVGADAESGQHLPGLYAAEVAPELTDFVRGLLPDLAKPGS